MIQFCNYKKYMYFNSYKLYCATKRKKVTEDTRNKQVVHSIVLLPLVTYRRCIKKEESNTLFQSNKCKLRRFKLMNMENKI